MNLLLGSKSSMSPVSSTGKRSYIPSTSSTSSIDSNLNTDEKIKHSKLIVLCE